MTVDLQTLSAAVKKVKAILDETREPLIQAVKTVRTYMHLRRRAEQIIRDEADACRSKQSGRDYLF